MCEKAGGTVSPLLSFVVAVKDGPDGPLDAGPFYEADHGPGAVPHLHEAALDGVGGAQLAPQVPQKMEEGQQLGQVSFQPLHHHPVTIHPMCPKDSKRRLGLLVALSPKDRLGAHLHRVVAPLPHLL